MPTSSTAISIVAAVLVARLLWTMPPRRPDRSRRVVAQSIPRLTSPAQNRLPRGVNGTRRYSSRTRKYSFNPTVHELPDELLHAHMEGRIKKDQIMTVPPPAARASVVDAILAVLRRDPNLKSDPNRNPNLKSPACNLVTMQ